MDWGRRRAALRVSPPPRAHNLATALPSLAAMGSAMVSVQVGAAFAKRLFPLVGAQGATALRVTLAALILLAVLRPWRKPLDRKAWPVLAAYGLSLGLMNACFYAALSTIPLGIAVALEFAGPLAVAVLASRHGTDFLWIALAVLGLAALLPLGHQSQSLDPLGIALALGAGFFWALYIVFGQKAGTAHGSQATAIGMAIAALVVPVATSSLKAMMWAPLLTLPPGASDQPTPGFRLSAAASSISLAVAAALRSGRYQPRMLVLPPVTWAPKRGFA